MCRDQSFGNFGRVKIFRVAKEEMGAHAGMMVGKHEGRDAVGGEHAGDMDIFGIGMTGLASLSGDDSTSMGAQEIPWPSARDIGVSKTSVIEVIFHDFD